MEGFSPEVFTATLALIGCVIVIAALFSGLIERSGMPQVAVFLAMGAMLGPMGLGLLDIRLDSPILRTVATLSLVLVLFTDAVSLSMAEVRRHGLLAFLVLGPGTLLSAVLIALAAWWLLDLTPAGAAILGAALASTDPVLLRGLLRGHDLPQAVRQALRLESGLNDVVLLPVVLAAMLILSQGSSLNISHWTQLGIDLFLLGPSAGVAVGLLSVASLDLVRRRIGVRRDYESLYSLGVVFAAYAAAEAVHGSGFLAAFTAGLTIAALDVELCDCFLEYGETTAEMALLFTFVLFGSSLIWQGLTIINGHTLLFAVIVLLIRPVVFLASLAGTSLDYHGRLLIAWFGPRGLSSLLLVLLPVFAGVPGGAQLFSLCCLVVLLSIVLHGGSLMLLNHRAIAAKAGHAEPPYSTLTAGSPAETQTNSLPSPGQTSSAAPINSPDKMTVAELRQLQQAGAPIIPLDVRTDRSYASSGLVLQGAQRLSPDNPVKEATQLNLPRDAWLAAFCACPNEETSGRVAQELRHAGWPQARALV
ncbi:MAG TPA: cation:proton antiporter, partial [Gammaproteobacteria bacterium]|nr:cation:proton antiporter [Gammaproteobacteria bacterium]